jgi:AcrR family transcriptional regulator
VRTRSEAKRQAILQAAAALFQDCGFERTTMSDIRERAGCSKPTLYSYFESKEELFLEVVLAATESEFQSTHAALDPALGNITQALQRFGERLLALLYSPPVRAVRRLLMSQAGRAQLGHRSYQLGALRSESAVAAFLQQAMDSGQLRQTDARLAARQLKALLEAEWQTRFLLQVCDGPGPDDIGPSVERAVSVFMAAYGSQRC